MRSSDPRCRAAVSTALAAALVGLACGGGGSGVGGGGSGGHTVPVSVAGAACGASRYVDEACVRVTICTPHTSTCQTVDGVLLDTGSYGLRLFKQVLTVSLSQVSVDGNPLAQCVQFGDGSADWGPVQTADVALGDGPTVTTPIQVIDATFGSVPSACGTVEQSPTSAGLNGVLGVGPFVQDCGDHCTRQADNGLYYTCNGSACSGSTAQLDEQLQNPIALAGGDGNGYVVDLPAVAAGGTTSVEGALRMGIGTHADNTPSGVQAYALDPFTADLTTQLAGEATTNGFFDTGSNGYFFAAPAGSGIATCAAPNAAWYCASPMVTLSATNAAAGGAAGPAVSFQVGDFATLVSGGSNGAFSEIAGPAIAGGSFDWGLPFFLGRKVYVGIDKRTSSLGTGPYVAY